MASPSAVADEAAQSGSDAATQAGLFGLSPRAVVLWIVILGGGLLRLFLAGTLGYGNGEAYYIATARFLALSYFDQPPLFLWLTHAMLDWGGIGHVWLRAPYVLMFAGTTWLMYRLGALLWGEAAGMWAAILLNLSALFFVSIGTWIQPDGPLFLFLLAGVLQAARTVLPDPSTFSRGAAWRSWLLVGLWFGLALLSKYHAILIIAGLFLFLVVRRDRRIWLARPQPWVGAALAVAIFLPAIIWNAQNEWVSFAFQGGRGASYGFRPDWLATNIVGQAAYLLPWIWVPLVWVFVAGLRRGGRDAKVQFLCLLAVIPIVLFTVMSSWARFDFHFHWQAPGYLMLFPLLGAAVARRMAAGDRRTRRWLQIMTPATFVLLLALGAQAATGWLAAIPGFRPAFDPTLEGLDWTDLRSEGEARGWFEEEGLFVVGTKWFQTGKIDVPLGDRLPVLCLCDDPRNLAFGWDQMAFDGHDAIIVIKADNEPETLRERWSRYFDAVTIEPPVIIHRAGRPEMSLHILRGEGFQAPFPMPLPPPGTMTARD